MCVVTAAVNFQGNNQQKRANLVVASLGKRLVFRQEATTVTFAEKKKTFVVLRAVQLMPYVLVHTHTRAGRSNGRKRQ